MNKKTIKIGDSFSKETIVTEDMIEGFARYSGDNNPIHLDEQYAKTSIFKNRIAHGLLISSFISAILGNDFPGNGTIYLSQSLKFLAPVFIEDKITTEVIIMDITKQRRVNLKTTCMNQNKRVVIDGEALVIPPDSLEIIND